MNRVFSPDFLISHAAFENLRRTLLDDARHEVLDQPLALLASSLDRNLPLALLDRTVNDILTTPFEDLYGTPSVGPKKILGLVQLLKRGILAETGADDGASTISFPLEFEQGSRMIKSNPSHDAPPRPTEVAEDIWDHWRARVARFNLGEEPLGRFARSLRDLPRSAWHTPLSFYYRCQLGEIRALPAHGYKRMAAVLKVFEDLHRILSNAKMLPHLAISVLPRLVSQVEHWAHDASLKANFPGRQEIETCLVQPLVGQIQTDADDRLAQWIIQELKPERMALSRQSASSGCSPEFSRFYWQKIRDIVQVRWPSGSLHVRSLTERDGDDRSPEDREFFNVVVQLFFGTSPRIPTPRPRHRNPNGTNLRCAPFVPRKDRAATSS